MADAATRDGFINGEDGNRETRQAKQQGASAKGGKGFQEGSGKPGRAPAGQDGEAHQNGRLTPGAPDRSRIRASTDSAGGRLELAFGHNQQSVGLHHRSQNAGALGAGEPWPPVRSGLRCTIPQEVLQPRLDADRLGRPAPGRSGGTAERGPSSFGWPGARTARR